MLDKAKSLAATSLAAKSFATKSLAGRRVLLVEDSSAPSKRAARR
jgi:hypothetical protein